MLSNSLTINCAVITCYGSIFVIIYDKYIFIILFMVNTCYAPVIRNHGFYLLGRVEISVFGALL